MPTPSPSSNETIVAATSLHSSCPPDDDRANWRVVDMDVPHDAAIATAPEVLQQPTPPPAESRPAGSTDTHIAAPHNTKQMDVDEDNGGPDMLSPMSAEGDKQEESELPALPNTDLGSPSMGYDFSNIRVCAPCLVVRYHCSATYFIFSLFHPRLLLFCAPEASFMGPSSRSAKYTMFRSRSSMWT